MAKNELTFEQYLSDIDPNFEPHVRQVHEQLTGHGCAVKLQEAKSGLVVSYVDPATGKVLANFVSRKKGPVIRVYAEGVGAYQELLETLPPAAKNQIGKAPACRRLLDPAKCNARCSMGYVFTLDGTEHKKCRYSCFQFIMDQANTGFILALLEREAASREAS